MAVLITFVDSTIPVANDWNQNNIAINTEVRPVATGGTGISTYVTGDILYASAAGVLSRLPLGSIVPVPQVLMMNAAGDAPAWRPLVGDRTGTDVTNVAAAETTVYTYQDSGRSAGTSVVPANTLVSSARIRLQMFGKLSNTSGATRTFRFRAKFGGTTVVDITSGNVATATVDAPVFFEVFLSPNPDTAAQQAYGQLWIAATGLAAIGTAAIDATADRALIITELPSGVTTSFTMMHCQADLMY